MQHVNLSTFSSGRKGLSIKFSAGSAYVDMRYSPKLTDFLDPREQFIVQSVVSYQNLVPGFLLWGVPKKMNGNELCCIPIILNQ